MTRREALLMNPGAPVRAVRVAERDAARLGSAQAQGAVNARGHRCLPAVRGRLQGLQEPMADRITALADQGKLDDSAAA